MLSAARIDDNTTKSPSEVKFLLSRHAQHPVGMISRFGIGYEYNPRVSLLGRDVDIKMHLYLLGAVLLELNIVSSTMDVLVSPGRDERPVKAMLLYLGLFTWFVTEYLWFENVHLYTCVFCFFLLVD
jgi:delta14-sterol reductase